MSGNITEIIMGHGYKMETYTTTTWDGYILNIFRIPAAINDNCENSKPKQPIFFVNGIDRDARCWLLMSGQSPALYYASKCYDVWLTNVRGTAYSKHINRDPNSKAYWDFSFHEQATIDIPANLDVVAKVTGQAGNIIYVGHSMGTTISYIYCSVNVTHCKNNLKAVISLAPIANLNKLKVPFLYLLAYSSKLLQSMFSLVHLYWFPLQPIFRLCVIFPIMGPCAMMLQFFMGKSQPNNYPEFLPGFMFNGSAPVGVKLIVHYFQIMIKKGRFAWYDHGTSKNLIVYNSKVPPLYDVSNIPVNVDLIFANDDLLSYKDDVMVLYKNLPSSLKSISEVPTNSSKYMNHIDFLISQNIGNVYDTINIKLKNYST
ncbi:gastric triacylglycerol lipase [Aethina tumida]|uniref:gastric triacylglycerol lipase n=1 Tax=Aethina tumida TaxID=116153 RepID=UPI00096AE8E0|nr:gastric triacylglycerol lipase [Aethina tumida]